MEGPSRILALDLSSRTGWALWSPGAEPEYGSEHFSRTGADVGAFLAEFDAWLAGAFDQWGPDLVVYEQPILASMTNITTLRKLYGLAGVTEMHCHQRDPRVACREVPIQKWRKHFIGRGSGFKKAGKDPKAECIRVCRERRFEPQDDNAADALGILDYTADLLGLPKDWPDMGLFGSAA